MRAPRFRIGWVMLVVALVAADFAVLRLIADLGGHSLFLGCVVSLPMANILAVALLLAFPRPRTHDFLRGFVLTGAVVSTLFLIMAFRREELLNSYLGPAIGLDSVLLGPPPRREDAGLYPDCSAGSPSFRPGRPGPNWPSPCWAVGTGGRGREGGLIAVLLLHAFPSA